MSNNATKFSPGSDEFFRWIFENAQIAIGILNIQTGEHFSNRAVEEMLGYSEAELRRSRSIPTLRQLRSQAKTFDCTNF